MDMGRQIETRLHNEKRRDWTPRDDEKLLTMRKGGLTVDEIADVLDRGRRSVEIRLERLRQRGIETHDMPRPVRISTSAGDTAIRDAAEGSKRLLAALRAYFDKYHPRRAS